MLTPECVLQAIAPIYKKAYWFFAAAGLAYFAFLSLLLNGTLQRHAIYAHKFHTAYWQSPNKPEQFGFLKNQVQPFSIPTPDGETLYGWHVLPLAFYNKHERSLLEKSALVGSYRDLLKQDPNARLIINFHGNAGHLANGWRTDTYRAVTTGASDVTHIITIDYRGYGYSTGSPTEQGLITDGLTITEWAMDTLGERACLARRFHVMAVFNGTSKHEVRDQGPGFACFCSFVPSYPA